MTRFFTKDEPCCHLTIEKKAIAKPFRFTDAQVRFANLLFVDNPVGTGYSYVTNESAYATNNSQIAADLVTMTSVFLTKMPEFQAIFVVSFVSLQNVPLYIFSESYGGKMAAEFALALHKAQASGKVSCKLAGVALGDGWLSPLDSTSTWGQYLYTMSFLDKSNLLTLNKVVSEIRQALVAGQGAKATQLWAAAEDLVEQLTNGVDWYNILQPQADEVAAASPLSLADDHPLKRSFSRHVAHFYNGSLSQLMNGPIKEKLGTIPKNVTWGGQAGGVFKALQADFMLPAVKTVDRLLNETDVRVAVYSGQLDLIVDALGTLQWMEQLKWAGMKEFQATAKAPMEVDSVTVGYYKTFKTLTLYWVLKAGHMVPADAPLGGTIDGSPHHPGQMVTTNYPHHQNNATTMALDVAKHHYGGTSHESQHERGNEERGWRSPHHHSGAFSPSLRRHGGGASGRERKRKRQTCVGDAILPSPQQVPSSGGPLKAPTLVPRFSSELSYSCPTKLHATTMAKEVTIVFLISVPMQWHDSKLTTARKTKQVYNSKEAKNYGRKTERRGGRRKGASSEGELPQLVGRCEETWSLRWVRQTLRCPLPLHVPRSARRGGEGRSSTTLICTPAGVGCWQG
ncbi:hypothetical protein HPB48_003219 [Haemaphysalis longicornis]|uniref:Carboxypeptidase n=1 Tax=Haemaphysalis longicornis TaxID=44386 RepID=A0A9J6FQR9_HAELO|nr:hypothetical protein HPB48_003219 [Haemaphysalis longicornis]